MHNISLSLSYLRHSITATLLNIITFGAGIALIVALLLTNAQLQNEFTKNLDGIDLVVGGKGSPMQLILSSVFHLDIPTGNIPLTEADTIRKHPLIKSAIPIALGDNYNGFRIVGTNSLYIDHYHGQLAQGRFFATPMEAVIGSDVAAKYQLQLNAELVGAHGLSNSDDLHSDFPYRITGILAPTHTLLDRLVLTPVESVWHVHEHPDPDDAEEVAHKKEHPGKEITALLITYKSPYAAVVLPRLVNNSSSMQAASPAFEVARLTSFMGLGTDTLLSMGWFLIALAGLGIFAGLYRAMDERRYDLALMRSFGAPPSRLFALIVTESCLTALIGACLGILLGHLAVEAFGAWIASSKHIHITGALFLPEEAFLLLAALLIGLVAAIIPAFKIYRLDIASTLIR